MQAWGEGWIRSGVEAQSQSRWIEFPEDPSLRAPERRLGFWAAPLVRDSEGALLALSPEGIHRLLPSQEVLTPYPEAVFHPPRARILTPLGSGKRVFLHPPRSGKGVRVWVQAQGDWIGPWTLPQSLGFETNAWVDAEGLWLWVPQEDRLVPLDLSRPEFVADPLPGVQVAATASQLWRQRWLVGGFGRELRSFDLRDQRQLWTYEAPTPIQALGSSPDPERVVALTQASRLILLERRTGREIAARSLSGRWTLGTPLSLQDPGWIRDPEGRIFSLPEGSEDFPLPSDSVAVLSSPRQGSEAATGWSDSGCLLLISAPGNVVQASELGPPPRQLAPHPDGVLACFEDRLELVRLCGRDVERTSISAPEGGSAPLRGLGLDPTGQWLLELSGSRARPALRVLEVGPRGLSAFVATAAPLVRGASFCPPLREEGPPPLLLEVGPPGPTPGVLLILDLGTRPKPELSLERVLRNPLEALLDNPVGTLFGWLDQARDLDVLGHFRVASPAQFQAYSPRHRVLVRWDGGELILQRAKDGRSKRLFQNLPLPLGPDAFLALSPDQSWLALGLGGEELVLVSLPEGRTHSLLRHPGFGPLKVAFAANSRALFVAGRERGFRRWGLPPDPPEA